ncbi:MAG: hypothetical protein PVJ57_12055 [Phycisphaerae bacterium]|jgi:hypothetical protein
MIGALLAAASAALVAGCGDSGSATRAATQPATNHAAVVAPLFEHGEGRTIDLSAPLSEDEAFQIISEELRQHGVFLTARNIELPSILVERREYQEKYDWISGLSSTGYVYFNTPLSADGMDPNRRVAVEFASADDVYGLAGPWRQQMARSSVIRYELKPVARYVADHARGRPAGVYFGVFYDPLEGHFDYDEFDRRCKAIGALPSSMQAMQIQMMLEREVKNRSVPFLRQQVRDFVEWLKGQGVI